MWRDAIPGIAVACLSFLAIALSLVSGLPIYMPWWSILVIPMVLVGLGWSYRQNHPDETRMFELPYFMGLWLIFPIFGCQITYLGIRAGFPFWDGAYARADLAMGFHWLAWWQLVEAHHTLKVVLSFAYNTSFWQPFVIVLLLVHLKPGRNTEFMTAILIGLFLTILGATFMPAVGPIATYGLDPHLASFIVNLRTPHPKPSWFMGIICFPSFHTVMALLFIWANRGLKTFWPFLALNLAMLGGVLTVGNHYLIDMAGGVAVALLAIWAAGKAPAEAQ